VYFPIIGYYTEILVSRLQLYRNSVWTVGFSYCLDSRQSPVNPDGLKFCYTIMYVRNKFSQHYFFSICWLSFTNHFLNQLQYLMITFLCMFDYPNNLFKRIPSVAVSADNRRSTV